MIINQIWGIYKVGKTSAPLSPVAPYPLISCTYVYSTFLRTRGSILIVRVYPSSIAHMLWNYVSLRQFHSISDDKLTHIFLMNGTGKL